MSAFEFNHGLIENVRPARNLVMQLRDEIVNYSHPPFRYDPELELLQEKCEQFLDNPIHKRLFDLYSLSEQVLWYHDFGCLYFGLSVKDGILGFPTLTSSFLILPTQRGESSRSQRSSTSVECALRLLNRLFVLCRKMADNSDIRLNLSEAAAKLGVSTRNLREMCKTGRITYTRIDRLHWSFRLADIEAFLKRNTFRAKTVYGVSNK